MPTPEPLKPQPAKGGIKVVVVVACLLWTVAITGIAATLGGQLMVAALIVAMLAVPLLGRYHPKAPPAVVRLSKVWLSHWKYSVTIVALTVAGFSAGRLKSTFDAMSPAQHLEAARADGKAMPTSAREHLGAIPSSAPEYKEAQKLLAELGTATVGRRDQAQLADPATTKPDTDRELAAFNAMTATQHLDAAERALAYGFDPKERIGGDLELAERHLDAIPINEQKSKREQKFRQEIAGRKRRTKIVWYREERNHIAEKLDQLLLDQRLNVESVQAVGKDHTILRVNYALCSRVLVSQLAQPEIIEAWRSKGFSRFECKTGDETIWLDLE